MSGNLQNLSTGITKRQERAALAAFEEDTKRQEREEEIRREQRKADAALVRAAGCICRSLYMAANGFDLSDYVSPEEGAPHYEECPIALAAILEGK